MQTCLNRLLLYLQLLPGLLLLYSCDLEYNDVPPQAIKDFKLYSDEIYTYSWGEGKDLLRMDVLRNDSIKVGVKVTFEPAKHGTFSVQADGETYYTPDEGFFGTDSLQYTVCSDNTCLSEKVKIIVEYPVDRNTCETLIVDEEVETTRNQWVDIRIHKNDQLCIFAYTSQTYYQPAKGRYDDISYAGGFKNTIFRYYPPKDYVGLDKFRYRMYLSDTEYVEGTTTIHIK